MQDVGSAPSALTDGAVSNTCSRVLPMRWRCGRSRRLSERVAEVHRHSRCRCPPPTPWTARHGVVSATPCAAHSVLVRQKTALSPGRRRGLVGAQVCTALAYCLTALGRHAAFIGMRVAGLLGVFLVTLVTAGCETILWSRPKPDPEISSGALPAFLVGEPIVVVGQPTLLLRAAADPSGTIHVLYLTRYGDAPKYAVVEGGKLRDGEMPPADLKLNWDEPLDAALDQHGKLHIIVAKHHFELSPDGWKEIADPGCRKFVPGGPNITCLFRLSEPDPRNKSRWDWFGFGGGGIFLAWPWPVHAIKVGIAERTEAGWVERGIVDRASTWDLSYASAVANRSRDVEVVYSRTRVILGTEGQLRYERFNAPGRPAAPAPTVRRGALGPDDASWHVVGVTATEVFSAAPRTFPEIVVDAPWIATDPEGLESVILLVESGGALWMRRSVGGALEPARMVLGGWVARRVGGFVTLADGRMIALLEERPLGVWLWSGPPPPLLRLMEYRSGKWSLPIEVGATADTNTGRILAVGADSVAVIGVDPQGRTYLRLIKLPSASTMRIDGSVPTPVE